MNVESLSDTAVTTILQKLMFYMAGGILDLDIEARRIILDTLVTTLDELDEDDTFGTEGWQHRFDVK